MSGEVGNRSSLNSTGAFFLLPLYLTAALVGFLFGGIWLWTGIVVYVLVVLLADNIVAESDEVPSEQSGLLPSIACYSTLPLVIGSSVLFAYHLSPEDALGLEQAVGFAFAFDLAAARNKTEYWHLMGGVFSMATVYSLAGGIVGHELMHRVDSLRDRTFARLILAFCMNTTLVIEHVFGHHRTVATPEDPTTAARGVAFWRYLPRSVVVGDRNAFRYEAKRLARQGRSRWHWRNPAITWQFATLGIAACFTYLAGWWGLLGFLAAGVLARIIIEAFNYVAHYGLVRVPNRPVFPRHSWNCYRALSSGIFLNLPRHSSHHCNASKYFWQLQSDRTAPTLPYPIGVMIVIALFPPLWHRVMMPRLADWDATMASEEERALLACDGALTDLDLKAGQKPFSAFTAR